MNRRSLNALAGLIGLLGLGGLTLDTTQLVDLPTWLQVLSIVASLGLGIWQKLPDRNEDGMPDVFQRGGGS